MSEIQRLERGLAYSGSLVEVGEVFLSVEEARQESRQLGKEQMRWIQGKEVGEEFSELLTAEGMFGRSGGRKGDLVRLGERPLNSLDLVQILVAKRNLVEERIRSGLRRRTTFGLKKDLVEKIWDHQLDIKCLTEQMKGALEVCDPVVDDYRVRGILEQAVAGDDRREKKVIEEDLWLPGIEKGPGYNELIVGVVIVLWREIDGRRKIYVQKETMLKEWCDKEPGDYTFVAEGRKRGESLKENLGRGLGEETGLSDEDKHVVIDPMPIGYYRFPQDESKGEVIGPWIVAFSAQLVSEKKALGIAWDLENGEVIDPEEVGPRDGETVMPGWEWEDYVEELRLRGGMVGIFNDWRQGRRRVVAAASPARR